MLDEMTPEQMDEWIAYCIVEPFGDEWRQTATIAAEAHNAAASDDSEVRHPEEYLPEASRDSGSIRRRGGLMDPADYERISAARYGSK